MLIAPENSTCDSLCSLGISQLRHTLPASVWVFFSCVAALMTHTLAHTHTHWLCSKCITDIHSSLNVSPLSPPTTTFPTSSPPAAVNYSSKNAHLTKADRWAASPNKKNLFIPPRLTSSLRVIVFPSPSALLFSSSFLTDATFPSSLLASAVTLIC